MKYATPRTTIKLINNTLRNLNCITRAFN